MTDSPDDLSARGRAIFERLREAAGQEEPPTDDAPESSEGPSAEAEGAREAPGDDADHAGHEGGAEASGDQEPTSGDGDAATDEAVATREAWAPMLEEGRADGPVDLDRSQDGPAPDGGMRADALLADPTMAPEPTEERPPAGDDAPPLGDREDAVQAAERHDAPREPTRTEEAASGPADAEPTDAPTDQAPAPTPQERAADEDDHHDHAAQDEDAAAGRAAGGGDDRPAVDDAGERAPTDVDDAAAGIASASGVEDDHALDAGAPAGQAGADVPPEAGSEAPIAGTNDPSADSSPTESPGAPATPERASLPGSVDLPPLDDLAPVVERDDLLAPAAASDELDEVPAHHASAPVVVAVAEPIAEPDAPEEAVSPFARPLPRVMAVANQKGGVGKTTTAVNLGACLADIGYRVLVVDLDPQGNASTGLGINIRDLQGSMYDVVLHDLPIEDCVEATSVRNLFCAPSSLDLAGAEIELVPAFSREQRLKRALEEVRDDYDFVLIDCPPSLGLLTVNGLAAATEVIVPIQCEYYALEGLGQLLRNVNLVQKNLNPVLEVSAIVLVMYDARTKLADQVVNEVRSHFGDKVCRNVIPRTVRLSEAPSFGQPIIAFDPSSRGAIAYRELAKEVSGGTPQRAG